MKKKVRDAWKNEPRMDFTGCLMDPLEDEAKAEGESELRDMKTRKINKKKERKAFFFIIAGSLRELSPFLFLSQ